MYLYSNNSVFSGISLMFAHLRDRKWYMVLIYISLLIIENIFWCPSDITLCVNYSSILFPIFPAGLQDIF